LALQQEGNPIFPGSIGENLTLRGISWGSMVPGLALAIGPIQVMITSYTKPCRTIRESFAAQQISRISEKVHPGWSRVYARVLREGTVSVGDAVRLQLTIGGHDG
jgi:MOSC domain-containing protein YiiM